MILTYFCEVHAPGVNSDANIKANANIRYLSSNINIPLSSVHQFGGDCRKILTLHPAVIFFSSAPLSHFLHVSLPSSLLIRRRAEQRLANWFRRAASLADRRILKSRRFSAGLVGFTTLALPWNERKVPDWGCLHACVSACACECVSVIVLIQALTACLTGGCRLD